MNTIEDLIQSSSEFMIKQKKEWLEILSGFESKNNYQIYNSDKEQLGFISEIGSGFLKVLSRLFLRSHRPFEIKISNNEGHELLSVHRPFFWFFSDLYVEYNGKKYGSIHRRFSGIYKTYSILDPMGVEIFQIKSPIWRLWTFPILNKLGNRVGVISKKWQGVIKEVFTDADAFFIDLNSPELTIDQRILLFVSGISIDFDFFEQNQGSGSLLSILDN
tara:strand:- start:721 stop:1374 length:654 start_codon:yes stop_codon:yes gene_type:complete